MTYTTSNGAMSPLTLDQMERAMREVGLLPASNEWMLISPDGRVWRGDVQRIFMVLAPHHPLLKLGSNT
jgi:hypothetical protein